MVNSSDTDPLTSTHTADWSDGPDSAVLGYN